MCGIIGVLGNNQAAPLMVEALKRLEYRGYDSAGIATINDGALDRRRALGKLVNLSDLLVAKPLAGKAGIGHTRWATHGKPSVANAHPHQAGAVAVVHNGIIENFRTLRDQLIAQGVNFESETDSETVAQLCAHHMRAGKSAVDAARATVDALHGAFALLFLFEGQDDLMIAARRGSPLAIGHGDGEMFVGSDALALQPITDRITYLEEGDVAVVTRAGVEIFDETGVPALRTETRSRLGSAEIGKGGHRHFMAKEIAEQPTVLADALAHYVQGEQIDMPANLPNFANVDRLILVACGTAFYACQTAKYWFEQIAGLPVEIDIASEFRYRQPPIGPRTAALFVSQSGETADTLAALRYAAGKADHILSVCNVPESSIARESAVALPTLAGVEIGVASTKAFTCQLAVLALLALHAGQQRGVLDADGLAVHLNELRAMPGLLNQALSIEGEIEAIAPELAEARDILFLGRGPMFPMALEGALKLKEISYIHAEGYASGELKHGPIALIDQSVPVIVFAPTDPLFDKTVSNMQEVMARQGKVLLVSDHKGLETAAEGTWATVAMPAIEPTFAPILYAIPAQLLAYHTAVAKGTDVDQPRNLAKSVTVE